MAMKVRAERRIVGKGRGVVCGGVEGIQSRSRGEKRQDPSYHRGKQGRGLVLGSSGASERKVFYRRSDSVHKGWERRKIGKGMEGKREELLSGERGQQGRVFPSLRGNRYGEEEI